MKVNSVRVGLNRMLQDALRRLRPDLRVETTIKRLDVTRFLVRRQQRVVGVSVQRHYDLGDVEVKVQMAEPVTMEDLESLHLHLQAWRPS